MTLTSPDILSPQQKAVIARGIARRVDTPEATPGGTPPPKEVKKSEEAANAWVKEGQEHGAESVLFAMNRGETTPPPPLPDAAKAKTIIEGNVGDTGKNLALQTNDIIRALLNGDTKTLEVMSGNRSGPLINQIKDIMGRLPEFQAIAAEIDALSTGGNNEWIKFLTQQIDAGNRPGEKKFMATLREKYTELMSRERATVDPSARVEAGAKLDRIDQRLQIKQAAETRTSQAMDQNRERAASYESKEDGSLGKTLGELTDQIKTGESQYKRDKADFQVKDAKYTQWRARVDAERDPAAKRQLLMDSASGLSSEIAQLKTRIEEHEGLVAEKTKMETERDGLDDAYDALADKSYSVKGEIEQLKREEYAAKATIEGLAAEQGNSGEDLGKEMGSLIGDSFLETMNARFVAEKAGIIDMLDKKIKAESDPHIKAAMTHLRDNAENRWNEWGRKGPLLNRKDVKIFDKDMARKDLDALKAGGQEDFVRRFLANKINPDTVDATHSLGMMYSKEQINGLLANKHFMENVAPIAVGMLLNEGIVNGMVSEKDMETIAVRIEETSWGKKAMEEARVKFKAIAEQPGKARKLLGASAEFLTTHKKEKGWFLLFLAFPIPALAVAGFYGGYTMFKKTEGLGKEHAAAKAEHKKEEHAPAADLTLEHA